jgi:hypothetical protein
VSIIRSFCHLARGLACVVAAVGALGAGSAAAATEQDGFGIVIHDLVALPGHTAPDGVSGFLASPAFPSPYWNTVTPGIELYRGGVLFKGPSSGVGGLDLADGDELRFVNLKPGASPRTLGTYVYRGLPRIDAPVCAGSTTVSGTRGPDARADYGGASAVLWKQLGGPVYQEIEDPLPGGPTTYPTYPGTKPYDSTYPGYLPGFTVDVSISFTRKIVSADRFTLTASRPLVAGMHLYHWGGFRPAPDLEVDVLSDQVVEDCSQSQASTPTPTPAPTGVPAPVAPPILDKVAPTGTLAGPSAKALKKLGARKLLKSGVPLKLTVSEQAQLKGTISLLGGKVRVRANVSQGVKPGASTVMVIVPNALRKALKKVSKKKTPRLQLDLALVDAAGNATALPPITIKLPRR